VYAAMFELVAENGSRVKETPRKRGMMVRWNMMFIMKVIEYFVFPIKEIEFILAPGDEIHLLSVATSPQFSVQYILFHSLFNYFCFHHCLACHCLWCA
jgi:hypothetical protein